MARTVGIGIQNFEKVIKENCFYIDKTDFIRQWWENKDEVSSMRPLRQTSWICSGFDGGITGQLCDFLQSGERA